MKVFITAVAIVGAFVTLLAAVCLLNGWVLLLMWQWFMPVVFPDIPLLSLPVAIGIALIATLLTHQDISNLAKKPDTKSWEPLVGLFSRPLFSLVLGWIVHQFV